MALLQKLTDDDKSKALWLLKYLQKEAVGKSKATTHSQVVSFLERKLSKSIDLKGARFRKMIQYLRLNGYPICSSPKGYWWGANRQEVLDCIKELQDRIEAQQSTLDAMKKSLKQYG